MKIVSSSQMTEIDLKTQSDFKIPASILMENAGIKAYEDLKRIVPDLSSKKIAFICGKGNNGGDAFVMARQFFNEFNKFPQIISLTKDLKDLSLLHYSICEKLGIDIIDSSSEGNKAFDIIKNSDVIVDAIYGTGIQGKARAEEIIGKINDSKAMKIAIDLPSGIGDSFLSDYPAIKADFTLTIGLPKLSLYMPFTRGYCGEIRVLNIGFPEKLKNENIKAELLREDDLNNILPDIPSSYYKNKRGHVAVLAGAKGTSGAAVLASLSAAHSRSGLVSLFADDDTYEIAASHLSSIMVKELIFKCKNYETFDSILLGPGWGFSKEKKELFESIIENPKFSGVIDADALAYLSDLIKIKSVNLNSKWILTPHPGEIMKFLDIDKNIFLQNPIIYISELAKKLNAFIILKMFITYIISPSGDIVILDAMNPALGTGGSGDVLAGIIASFVGSELALFDSAKLGVLVHSLAGKKAFAEKGWFLAEDLPGYISKILK